VCLDADERENIDPSFSLEAFWTRIGTLLHCISFAVQCVVVSNSVLNLIVMSFGLLCINHDIIHCLFDTVNEAYKCCIK